MREVFRKYIRDELTKSEFCNLILEATNLEFKLGRSAYLRLKHGYKDSVLTQYQELNRCKVCSSLHSNDLRSDKGASVTEDIYQYIENGILSDTQQPEWYIPHLAKRNHLSVNRFLNCSECGGVLEYGLPERVCRGYCELIG